ncbi:MAG TPA: hypothetical protein VM345_18125 [Acidimicrobiales bacterium]|jgi:hypothetical protein|nr:hypothetical protein [Acidimicrobiales bacterium]
MERLVVAAAIIAVAVIVAIVLERRRPQPPTQPRRWEVPPQLDRADFPGADKPWLVVVFTSNGCETCGKVVPKVSVLDSPSVEVVAVAYQDRQDLHERYSVDVVPMTLVADAEGVVRASFIGEPTATDLWAAVAEVREPGSSPEAEPPGVL